MAQGLRSEEGKSEISTLAASYKDMLPWRRNVDVSRPKIIKKRLRLFKTAQENTLGLALLDDCD